MFCLTYFIPGKTGRIIRRIMLPIATVVLVYLGLWVYTLSRIKFESPGQAIEDNHLVLTLRMINNAFATVEILKMDMIDKKGKTAAHGVYELPVAVKGHSHKDFRVGFQLAEYKEMVTVLRTLYKKHTIHTPIKPAPGAAPPGMPEELPSEIPNDASAAELLAAAPADHQ